MLPLSSWLLPILRTFDGASGHIPSVFAHSALLKFATLLATVKTQRGIWIAADGRRCMRSGDRAVCKVHETPFGVVGKANAIRGVTRTGKEYSTDKVAMDVAAGADSAEAFMVTARWVYEEQIWDQLAFLMNEPNTSISGLAKGVMGFPIPNALANGLFRQLVCISAKGGALVVRHLTVSPTSRPIPSGGYRYSLQVQDCADVYSQDSRRPKDVGHPSLFQYGVEATFDEDDALISADPEGALRRLIQKSSTQFPGEVGPPYSIAFIRAAPYDKSNPSGLMVEWLESGACPGWDLTV